MRMHSLAQHGAPAPRRRPARLRQTDEMARAEKAEKLFESLAREMLAQHPAIKHEWRPIKSRWRGDRLDLACNPDSVNEVWATIREAQIAVGDRDSHQDFEDFGRRLSESALAHEAFRYLVALLREHGNPEVAA